MGETCETCGESECWALADWSMGGAPGEYEEAMAKHYRLGYEREKARADAAEASRDEWRSGYIKASVTGRFPISPHDNDPEIRSLREAAEASFHGQAYAEMAKRARVAEAALAAARRECEFLRSELAATKGDK